MLQNAATQKSTGEPAAVTLLNMAAGHGTSQAIHVAARLGLADLLADGPRSAEELARETKTDAESLYRLLRMLAGAGLFAEEANRSFRLGPLGEPMRSDVPGSLRSMLIHLGEAPSWKAWGALYDSVRTGETGFVIANGSEIFPFYAEHPESNEPFNRAMTEYSEAVSEVVARGYDFSRFEKIVDVGGGHGHLLATVLKANPKARGVVFDLPAVVEGASAAVDALDGRLATAGGDFFVGVAEGGDAYLLKHIIHDWDERRALQILRNVHRAMKTDGVLLLVEHVIPEGDEPSFSRWMDVHMMVMTGGRERTEAEYAELYDRAGFRLTRVVETESAVSIIEGVKK